jgi:hypothetical protein
VASGGVFLNAGATAIALDSHGIGTLQLLGIRCDDPLMWQFDYPDWPYGNNGRVRYLVDGRDVGMGSILGDLSVPPATSCPAPPVYSVYTYPPRIPILGFGTHSLVAEYLNERNFAAFDPSISAPMSFVQSPAFSVAASTGTGQIQAALDTDLLICTLSSFDAENVGLVPPPPPSTVFPHGVVSFEVGRCSSALQPTPPGLTATTTLVVQFPAEIPPTGSIWVFSATSGLAQPHWYSIPASIDGSIARFRVWDGGDGDATSPDDGIIRGRVALGVPVDPPVSYQGLWWGGERESGWGVNVTHQGAVLFATWFTYDADGSGMWLVMSNGALTSPGNYSGTLYSTTGPAFNAAPFTSIGPSNYTEVGTLSLAFADANSGTMRYTVNGVTRSKPIKRYVYSSTVPTCTLGGGFGTTANYQDLWWSSPANSESGWGINITHQGDTLFATWFTYLPGVAAANKGMWLVMSNGAKYADGSYGGDLQTTTGPSFDAMPFDPARVVRTTVGSGRFYFGGSYNGTFLYTVNGISGAKPITRYVYGAPTTTCR